jgi:hypothetical protein
MAQGASKLASSKKSGGGNKRKEVNSKKRNVAKGKRTFGAKGRKTFLSHAEKETTRSINKKNEVLIAAKAVSVGTKFFMSDVNDKGTKKHNEQLKQRNKKQDKGKLSNRLKDQLQKLGKEL